MKFPGCAFARLAGARLASTPLATALLASALLATTLCGAELRPVAIPGTGLQIGAPTAWTAVLPADGTVLRLGPANGQAGLAVTVSPLAEGQGLGAFTDASLTELRKMAYGFELLDWDFDRHVGARTWSLLHYRLGIGETRWEQQLWLTVDNGQGIAVACSASPATWAAWQPVFARGVAEAGISRPVLKK
jgi:hypothetical protein